MTEQELRQIEQTLDVVLPPEYREASKANPFAGMGKEAYWWYDTPEAILNATLAPLADGEYDGMGWEQSFVIIGNGAAGDLYVLDTAKTPAPVYCLSHEDETLALDFPDLSAYIACWREEIALTERRIAEDEASRKAEAATFSRRLWRVSAAFFFGIVLCFLLLCLIPLLRRA